jgi:Sec-independent protein secretion pathway component TatC
VPMYLLYEVGILLARFALADREQRRSAERI